MSPGTPRGLRTLEPIDVSRILLRGCTRRPTRSLIFRLAPQGQHCPKIMMHNPCNSIIHVRRNKRVARFFETQCIYTLRHTRTHVTYFNSFNAQLSVTNVSEYTATLIHAHRLQTSEITFAILSHTATNSTGRRSRLPESFGNKYTQKRNQ